MRLKCWLGNTTLTRRPGANTCRNDSYTVRTYVADTGHGAHPYFVGRFELSGAPDEHGWIWTHGRFKGYKARTPLFIGYAHQFVEPLEIPDWFVSSVRRAGGHGKKARYVQDAKGFVWLPDGFRFSHPLSILEYAMGAAARGEVHAMMPNPPYWPEWVPGGNVVVRTGEAMPP